MAVALGAIVRLGTGGRLTRLATDAESHAIGGRVGDALLDVLMY